MDTATARNILTQKEPANLYDAVGPVLKDAGLRGLLVEGCISKNETYRYNCVRVLCRALEQQPGLFYPFWDQFEGMIASPNGFHRAIAAQAIARLAPVDTQCRLDVILDEYLALLDDPKVMVTHYFLEAIGIVYVARPDLQNKIIATLLDIDKTKHLTGRKDLIKADIIVVFDQIFDSLPAVSKKKIGAFVEAQLESSSPKARKAAREFGKKYR